MGDSVSRARRITLRVAVVIGVLATAGSLLGLIGNVWWGFDLFAHFRWHYALVLAVAVLVTLVVRRWDWALIFVPALVIDAVLVAPAWMAPPPPANGAPALTLQVHNVNLENSDHDAVLAQIRASDADVIGLVEVTPGLDMRLRELKDFQLVAHARPDAFGLAVLTRVPVASKLIPLVGTPHSALQLELEHGGEAWSVLLLHAPPPAGSQWTGHRAAAIAAAEAWAAQAKGHAIVAGDFNATPWSAPMRALTAGDKLVIGGVGHGLGATWPSSLGAMGIAIDHVLHDPSLTCTSYEVLDGAGSDHRAIRASLARRQ